MNSNDIAHLLAELKMPAFKEHYMAEIRNPDTNRLTHEERLFHALEAEFVHRKRMRFERLLKASKIKYSTASIEALTFDNRRNLERGVLLALAICDWVKFHQNIILTGLTGVGKTHIASGLGIEAIKRDYRVLFKRLPTLLDELEVSRAEGRLLKYMAMLSRFQVLIIDDFGLPKLTARSRRDLLEIVEEKTGKGSIIITSQMPVEKWHEYIGDDAIADAILDRLIHKAHIIDIQGESMRRQQR